MRAETLLGRGLVLPFRRESGDFANAEGAARVEARVLQVLNTRQGELRWRPGFGTRMEKTRHRNMTETQLIEDQAEITNALLTNEPQIEILSVTVERESVSSTKKIGRVVWRAVTRGTQRNAVLTDPQTTEVKV